MCAGMFSRSYETLRRLLARAARETDGSIAIQFAFAMIALGALVGGGLDFCRAVQLRVNTQATLDAAALAGAKDGTSNWSTIAQNAFNANVNSALLGGATPSFSIAAQGNVAGAISASLPTSLMQLLGFRVAHREHAFRGAGQ